MPGIQKKPKPDPNAKKPEAAKLTDLQRAERALVSQGWPNMLAACLSPQQQAAVAATLGADDLATAETVTVVECVVQEYHDEKKATVDPPAPAPTVVDSPLN
jgi:hypothetical protein